MSTLIALLMAAFSAWILFEYLRTFLTENKCSKTAYIYWAVFYLWQVVLTFGVVKIPSILMLPINSLIIFMVTFSYNGSVLQKGVFAGTYVSMGMLMELLIGYIFILVNKKLFLNIIGDISHLRCYC